MRPNDPIADLLTRVRNAQKAGHEVVSIPASKMKIGIAHILKEEGFVKNYKCIRDGRQGVLKIALKYDPAGRGVIKAVERISKPSHRIYVGIDKIPYVKNGFGVAVLSTPKGLMTDRDARKHMVGGEYVCSIF